jgi:hypothetical protein
VCDGQLLVAAAAARDLERRVGGPVLTTGQSGAAPREANELRLVLVGQRRKHAPEALHLRSVTGRSVRVRVSVSVSVSVGVSMRVMVSKSMSMSARVSVGMSLSVSASAMVRVSVSTHCTGCSTGLSTLGVKHSLPGHLHPSPGTSSSTSAAPRPRRGHHIPALTTDAPASNCRDTNHSQRGTAVRDIP